MATGVGRRIPVFISSTFRDMDRERDLINSVVIPAVNQRVAELGLTVYAVDLRWGIDTSDKATFDDRQRAILEVCLDEVARCRPLFVGLLGDRFGSIPPSDIQRRSLQRLGIEDPGFPLSVLAIEVLASCVAADGDGFEPMILRRAKGPIAVTDALEQEAILVDALARLLHDRGVDPVLYEAETDQSSESLSDSQFVRILTDAIESGCRRIPVPDDELVGWLDAEMRAQETHRRRLAEAFIGREAEIEQLRTFCDPMSIDGLLEGDVGDDIKNPVGRLRWERSPRRMSIVGPSGVGKSALAARLVDELELADDHPMAQFGGAVVAFVSVGVTAATDRLAVCLLVSLAQFEPQLASEIADRSSAEDLRLDDVHQAWLAALGRSTARRIAILDGLDRLHIEDNQSQTLGWLPETVEFSNRVVLTVAEDTLAHQVLTSQSGSRLLDLGVLSRVDAEALVRSHVAAHHRSLPDGIEDVLVTRSRLARWLVVATDLLLTLSSYDYELVEEAVRERHADPETAIAGLLRSIADDLPAPLDELHQEAFERLTDVVGANALLVLALVGLTMNGLREQDLVAITTMAEQPLVPADLALMRSTLCQHVTVDRDLWTFVHASSYAAMGAILDDAPPEAGVDVTGGLYGLLATYLVRLPPDDPIRRSELLPALFWIPAPAKVAEVLHDSSLSHLADLRQFASLILGVQALGGDIAERLLDVIEAATEPDARLTAASFIISSLVALQPPEQAVPLGSSILASLRDVPEGSVSRFGETAEDLTEHLEMILVNPFSTRAEDADSPAVVLLRWQRALMRGEAGLADLPRFIDAADDLLARRRAVILELSALSAFGQAAIVGAVVGEPNAANAAVTRFVNAQQAMERCELTEPVAIQTLELARLAAARALATAWPDAGVVASDGDLAFARQLAEGTSASSLVVSLYAQLARLTALALAPALEDGTASPEEIYRVSVVLDQALDRLAVERAILPDVLLIESEWLMTESIQAVVLADCDQIASACRHGIAMTGHPRAIDVFGWEQFSLVAFGALVHWLSAFTTVDPAPVVVNLTQGYDEHGPPAWSADDEMPWTVAEMLSLTVAFRCWTKSGDQGSTDLVLGALERLLDLEDGGLPALPADDEMSMSVVEVVHESLALLEDGMAEDIVDALEEGEVLTPSLLFEPDEIETVARVADTVGRIRRLMTERRGPLPAEPFSVAFWDALDGFVHADGARQERVLVTLEDATESVPSFDALSDREQLLFAAAGALLGLDLD